MGKYIIEVEVNDNELRRLKGVDVGDESIESLILEEMGWVEESGIYVRKVEEYTDQISVEDLGIELSDIINQDGDEKTDGKVIDEIVERLSIYNIYKTRQ